MRMRMLNTFNTVGQHGSNAQCTTMYTACIRGGHRSGVPESAPAGFWVFLSDPDPESKFVKTRPGSGVTFYFRKWQESRWSFLTENIGKFMWDRREPKPEQERNSQIWKISGPGHDPDFTILEQGRSRSLKKWLLPSLICIKSELTVKRARNLYKH